jgi:DNA-binding NtrC family response regulator
MVFYDLSGLVIEAESERRARCSQAARENNSFKRISAISNPREFSVRISQGQVYDVVFIGCSVRVEHINDVVRVAKAHSEDCTCILVAGAHQQDALTLASTIMGGVDGFLYEPFSVDGLNQVAKIAQELKRVNNERRIKASIQLIIGEMLDTVDDLSFGKLAARRNSDSSGILGKLISTIQQFGNDSMPFYYEELVERSSERRVPIPPTIV